MTKPLRQAALLLLLAAALGLAPANAADQPQLALSADRNRAGVGESLELQLNVSGAGASSAGEPVIEGVEHFDLLGTSHGDQLSIVNMNITRSTTWRYTLRPKKAGETVTLRAKVPVGGANYLSNTVTVETTTGGGGPGGQAQHPPPGMFNLPPGLFNLPFPPGARGNRKDDFILQARVTPASVYAGEEAIYTIDFYQGADVFSNVNFVPPTLKNIWTEQPEESQRHETKAARLGGRDYTLTEVRMLLYPMSAGDAAIPAAAVSFQAAPFSPPVSIKSNELTLKVKPLPEKGRPAGFSGLVGKFAIAASVPQQSAAAGQPLTLAVTVTGRGALHAIPKPDEPAIDAERFDPEIKDAFTRGANGTEGSRTFSYIIVPKKEGTLAIPPFSLTFFNPVAAAYETVRSAPLALTVSSAAAGAAPPSAPVPSAAPEVKAPAAAEGAAPYPRPLLYALTAAALTVALAALLHKRRRAAGVNGAAAKAQSAGPSALERLARAEEFLQRNDTAAFLGAVEHAMRHYLSGKLNIAPSAITPDDINRRLPPDTLAPYNECLSVLQVCFDARYAPGTVENPAALLERAKKAVAKKV